MRELVDLKIILQVLKTLDPESLSCQTLGLPECAPFLDGTFSKAAQGDTLVTVNIWIVIPKS